MLPNAQGLQSNPGGALCRSKEPVILVLWSHYSLFRFLYYLLSFSITTPFVTWFLAPTRWPICICTTNIVTIVVIRIPCLHTQCHTISLTKDVPENANREHILHNTFQCAEFVLVAPIYENT